MKDSFIDWLMEWVIIVITAPFWIIPFLFWYFFEWRKKQETAVEVAHGSSHTGEPERESILNTFLNGSYE